MEDRKMNAVLTKEQLEELREFDTPTICNAIEGFNIRPRTSGYANPGMLLRTGQKKPMVGYAATAKVGSMYPGEGAKMMEYYESVREMPDPTIAVIQDIDPIPKGSFWGEVNATTHMALGAIGTLTDGGVRDLEEVSELGFYFFSSSLVVSHGYTHVESYNCPVEICGLIIRPGDLIHADQHGVTVIPPEVAPKLAAACRRAAAAELPMLEPCREAIKKGVKPTMEEIRKWRADMDQKRKELAEADK